MSDLSKLRSLRQLENERMRLEQQSQRQKDNIFLSTHTIRHTWQKRMERVDRFAEMFTLLLPKVGQGTLLLTLLSKLINRIRK